MTVSAQQHLVPSSGYGVMVILNSSTIVTGHPWNISDGIIEITEGREPGDAAPVAILIDLGLGVLTILTVGIALIVARLMGRRTSRPASPPNEEASAR